MKDWLVLGAKKNVCPEEGNIPCHRPKLHWDMLFNPLREECITSDKPNKFDPNDKQLNCESHDNCKPLPCKPDDCTQLPECVQRGCRLFCEWGFAGFHEATAKVVKCPENFVKHLDNSNTSEGPRMCDGKIGYEYVRKNQTRPRGWSDSHPNGEEIF